MINDLDQRVDALVDSEIELRTEADIPDTIEVGMLRMHSCLNAIEELAKNIKELLCSATNNAVMEGFETKEQEIIMQKITDLSSGVATEAVELGVNAYYSTSRLLKFAKHFTLGEEMYYVGELRDENEELTHTLNKIKIMGFLRDDCGDHISISYACGRFHNIEKSEFIKNAFYSIEVAEKALNNRLKEKEKSLCQITK